MTTEEPAPRRGELWWVDFAPVRGAEQAGRRPALVIQNDAGNESALYPNTIVLAVTTRGRRIPFHVRVEAGPSSGLRETSWVKCEQMLTISKSRLLGSEPIGRLAPEALRKVEVALLLALGIGV